MADMWLTVCRSRKVTCSVKKILVSTNLLLKAMNTLQRRTTAMLLKYRQAEAMDR